MDYPRPYGPSGQRAVAKSRVTHACRNLAPTIWAHDMTTYKARRLERNKQRREDHIIYPQGVSWECTRCAKCCGDTSDHIRRIMLLGAEAENISRQTGAQITHFAEATDDSDSYTLVMRKKKGHCIFLKEGACRIYEVRPLVCRFYPVWLKQEGSSNIFGIDNSCSGFGRGKCLDREYYVSLLRLAQARFVKAGSRSPQNEPPASQPT
jgi:Fe-S-cluster containining protein